MLGWLRAAARRIVEYACWLKCRYWSVPRFCRVKRCSDARWFLELSCCWYLCVDHTLRRFASFRRWLGLE